VEAPWQKRLLVWPPQLFLLVFFAAPVLLMFFASFRTAGEFGGLSPLFTAEGSGLTFDNYLRIAQKSTYLRLFIRSIAYAGITTLFCLLLAYPVALTIATGAQRWRNLLLLLVILPFWSNFLIRIYAWMFILSPEGFLMHGINGVLGVVGLGPVQLLFTPVAVVLCLVYVNLPFMILPLYSILEKQDPALLDAAQDLGASRWQRFWRVTFPLSLPGVFAGSALVFIPALGMFAVPDLLGGTEGVMIANVIKQQFLESRDWPFGSSLSVVLTLLVLLTVALATRIGQRKEAPLG